MRSFDESMWFEVVPPLTRRLFDTLGKWGYGQPVYVPVIPAEGASLIKCFWNVQDVIEEAGGSMVCGRSVWQGPCNWWLSLEAHAIWQRPDGSLIDVTPTGFDVSSVAFIPGDWDFDGHVKPTDYIVTSKLRIVQEFIAVSRAHLSVQNQAHTLAREHKWKVVQKRRGKAFARIVDYLDSEGLEYEMMKA